MSADAAYRRKWRSQRNDSYRRSVAVQNARLRALRRLGEQYPRVLERLYQEELDAAGLEWSGLGGPGQPKKPLQ